MIEPNTKEADPTAIDFGWVAGFLEGEGAFYNSKIYVTQVQREPLERLQKWFGGVIRDFAPSSWSHKQPYHRWDLYGTKARWLMSIIYGLMSPRRQEQISSKLAIWGNWDFYCKQGHPKIEENLTVVNKHGSRACRICRRISRRAYRARQRITR